jgi:hypothetical protein
MTDQLADGLRADLEVGLSRGGDKEWRVELRFSYSEPGTVGADTITPGSTTLEPARLDSLGHGGPRVTGEYGRVLTESLFSDPNVKTEFARARTAASVAGVPLRLRLRIAPSAPELHALRWETLLDPDDGSPLLTNKNVLFSRYLTSTDWRPVPMRLRSELRALIVAADPTDLADYQRDDRKLAPIDVTGELARARRALQPIHTSSLTGEGGPTLTNLISQLREGFDVVYLVCHGYLVNGEPQLLLERDDGTAHVVHGHLLVQRLKELQHLPRLIVLASCQSATSGDVTTRDDGALAALAPQLIEIGVPAVLAMQGDATMRTVERFLPAFFKGLQRHGRIDQAMAEARSEILDRFDWWVSTLFMRLHSGRLWYAAGFGRRGFDRWPALVNDIYAGACLPLLGPGMTDTLIGTRQQIARALADRYQFPLAPYFREDMPQVAQFLAVALAANFPVAELRDHLVVTLSARLSELCEAAGQPVPERFRAIPRATHNARILDDLMTEVWGHLYANLEDPFAVLARLPLPIYVTAQPFSLLTTALRAQGRKPRVEITRWNRACPRSIFDREPDYEPTPDEPLIFHIFGDLQHQGSVVLREDDYFEFLRTTGRDSHAIPDVVRSAFADSALLFLGFRVEDWDFRVLFHSIMSQEGGGRLDQHSHVAAQIDPEEGLTLEPEGARRYFESYFRKPHDVSVFWGSVENFLKELGTHVEGDQG